MATLDPSIILSGQRPADPMQTYGQALQLKSLLGQQRLADMQMQQAERDLTEQRTLADLYRGAVKPDGTIDRGAVLGGAATQGLGARIPGLQKQFAEADKASADLGKVKTETQGLQQTQALKKLEATGGMMASLLSSPNVQPEQVLAGIQSLVNAGVMTPEEGARAWREVPTGSPQELRAYLVNKGLQVMDAKDRLAATMPKIEYQDTGKQRVPVDMNPITNPSPQPLAMTTTPGQDLQSRDNAAARQVQIRGQNLTDARAREQSSAAQFIPVDGVGLYVGDKRTGVARPVTDQATGQPIVPNKALTEGQAKANLFGTRAQEADRVIQGLAAAGKGTPSFAQQITGGQGITGRVATAFATPEQQQADQAQRDFINAVLRRESGAVIADSEFDNARLQYFPQPGDSPQVIAQKARNRTLAIQGILDEVPANRRMQTTAPPAPAAAAPAAPAASASAGNPPAPKIGDVQDGWVYNGGDPSQPSSWRKVK